MEGSNLVVRPYREGDEEGISEVYERCYSAYSGHVKRTPVFWLWFNLRRPGVRAEGVLVAERNGRPVGSITVTPAGELLDPCYDPGDDGDQILGLLLRAAEETAVGMGIERLLMNVPRDDPVFNRACHEAAMGEKELRRTFSINIANRCLFLSRILERSRPPQGGYLLDVRRGRESVERLYVRVGGDGCQVSNDEEDVDLSIQIQEGTLLALIFDGLRMRDWLLGRVGCSPFWKVSRAHGLLRSLDLGSTWFVPRGGTF